MAKSCAICGKNLHLFLTGMLELKDGYLCLECGRKIGLDTDSESFKVGRTLTAADAVELAETNHTVGSRVRGLKSSLKKSEEEKNIPKCPKCNSKNIQPLGVHKKGFSVGKAVVGGVLTNGVGVVAGFAGKKTKKTDFVCLDCGKQFKL